MALRDLSGTLVPALAAGASGAIVAAVGAAPAATAVAAALAALGGAAVTVRRGNGARSPRSAGTDPQIAPGLGEGAGRALIERLPIGVVILDAAGRIAFVNRRAAELFGRRVPVGHQVAVIRAPALLDAIAESRRSGAKVETDLRLTAPREVDLHAHVMPLEGAPPGVLIVIEDHTRARRIEALRRDFIADASHELKTPLASILGSVETLQGHARDDGEARGRFLEIMAAQAMRMKRLVDDLLSLSRIELNEHVRPSEPQRPVEIAAAAAAALQPVAAEHGVGIEVAGDIDTPPVPGDRSELIQVFVNLIDNAIKYGGGKVRVFQAVGGPGGMVGMSVADDGPGIAREHLPRLTERFYRVSVPRSREAGGTGLGLAIVKHILARHRGHLAIDSEPGAGAVFTVWLPIAEVTRGASENASISKH